MSDYPVSFENLQNFLSVSEMDGQALKLVRDKIKKGLSIAFLVTGNFEIHISTTGVHKDINLPSGTAVMEKGRISGSARKIHWVVSDFQKDVEISSAHLASLQNAIKEKINEYLDLDFYLQ